MSPILEICVDTLEDAVLAQTAGADRLELCAGIPIGGITPSAGFMQAAAELEIPVYTIIRPRDGDFCYNPTELNIMKVDVLQAKQANLDGIVFGILTTDHQIDIEASKQLIELAAPLPATLHRAFDVTSDPEKALEDAISAGFKCILTSGQATKAIEGGQLLAQLDKIAAGRIRIMPGGGVSHDSAADLMQHISSNELHASCAEVVSANEKETGKKFGFEPANGLKRLSKSKLIALKSAMQEYHLNKVDNTPSYQGESL
jgi:copper homeostasis protein